MSQGTHPPQATPGYGVSVLGIGASGVAAARLALAHGEPVYVTDLRTDPDAQARARELRDLGAHVELGAHDLDRITTSHTVVASPGIPPHAPVLEGLRQRGVRWIGEPEFAIRFLTGELIAVTGTNGKTTTVLWLEHVLRCAGMDAVAGGNVGGGLAPAASELALRVPNPAYTILEMSSFQLADTERFAPTLGVVTSLAPDHLDRYESLSAYWGDKARLFRNARATDRWVLNGDAPSVRALPGEAPGVRYLFGVDPDSGSSNRRLQEWGTAAFLREGVLTLRIPQNHTGLAVETPVETPVEIPLLPASELPLLGAHNVMNALATALAAGLLGALPAQIIEGLRSFRPLPHRLAPVARVGEVLWVNDSKATNVSAAVSALESLDGSLVVILGGKEKGEDFTPLLAPLSAKARVVVVYGEAGPRIQDTLGVAQIVTRVGPFDAAVAVARDQAQAGDLVVLTPACASFDQFSNYEARGARFAELVHGFAAEVEGK